MLYNILTNGEKKRVVAYTDMPSIFLRKFEWDDKDRGILPYLVTLNGEEQTYMYDGKFYQDEVDHEKTREENEKITELVKKREEEGKTDDEIQEEIQNVRNHYVHRVEYIIFVYDEQLDIADFIPFIN